MDEDDQSRDRKVSKGVDDAERAYVAGLIARGEAAPVDEDGRLPAGATHELVEDDDGHVTARRRRFTAF